MSRRRGPLGLMRDILMEGNDNFSGAGKAFDTRRKSASKCFVVLWESGMLERACCPGGLGRYHTTVFGRKILRTIEEVIDILDTNIRISI